MSWSRSKAISLTIYKKRFKNIFSLKHLCSVLSVACLKGHIAVSTGLRSMLRKSQKARPFSTTLAESLKIRCSKDELDCPGITWSCLSLGGFIADQSGDAGMGCLSMQEGRMISGVPRGLWSCHIDGVRLGGHRLFAYLVFSSFASH